MPNIFIVKTSGRSQKTDAVSLGGTLVEFRRAIVRGESLMVAEVEPDSPALEIARQMPRSYKVLKADPEALEYEEVKGMVPAQHKAKTTPVHSLPAPIRGALRNGWSREDVEGTCKHGKPGPVGGRSEVTGLCASEMAICQPPKDWETTRGTMWPWEDLRWRGPGIGWRPPAMAPRLHALVEEVVEPDTAPANGELVTEVGVVEVVRTPGEDQEYGTDDDEVKVRKRTDTSEEEEPEAAEPEEEKPEAPEVEPDEMPLDHEDNAVLLTYSESLEVVQAAANLLAFLERNAGTAPSVSKANYHLKKNTLPSVNASKLAALLRVPAIG